MGHLVFLTSGKRPQQVFIKKTPAEMECILNKEEHRCYCTLEEYVIKYKEAAASTVITQNMKDGLVALGLVPESAFKEGGGGY